MFSQTGAQLQPVFGMITSKILDSDLPTVFMSEWHDCCLGLPRRCAQLVSLDGFCTSAKPESRCLVASSNRDLTLDSYTNYPAASLHLYMTKNTKEIMKIFISLNRFL